MQKFVMVRTFTSEETDPRWAVKSGLPMQVTMGNERGRIHLTEVKVERSGFSTFKGTMADKAVEGFYGLKESGPARRLLSGLGMVMIRALFLMIVPSALFLM